MDMRNQAERRFDITMRHVDGFLFTTQASEDGVSHGQPFASDEPDPVGANSGPATPALLATAVAHCLSASLLETSHKARLPIIGIETRATAVVAPNAEGHPRIRRIEVMLAPQLTADSPRRLRCEEGFQNYCTVSSSLKPAIAIQVAVDWRIVAAAPTDLEAVGMADRAKAFPAQLSGGQQQRVAIARALVKRAPLVLADEPTGNLDPHTGEQVLEVLLKQCREAGSALILVTHNEQIARRTSSALTMAEGGVRQWVAA